MYAFSVPKQSYLPYNPRMERSKQVDLDQLSRLAFRKMGDCARVVEKFFASPHSVQNNPELNRVYDWLFVPLSLWPVDISGTVDHLIELLESGKKPDRNLLFLISLLESPPPQKTCQTIANHEHLVKNGSYESLIKAQHKFDLSEKELCGNAGLLADWNTIKNSFDVSKYQNAKGVIRRRMTSERNFHPKDWEFSWHHREDKFRLVFDAFCHKWALYGMEHDKPLLQKLSVTITPLGTMIFIPRYWSFDYYRDVKWNAIKRLHESRGVNRQGPKLSLGREQRRLEATEIRKCWKDATAQGLKGDARVDYVISKRGMNPETSERQIRRLLKVE